MNRSLTFLLAFCLIVFMASFYFATLSNNVAAYSLSVISFVAFFSLFAVGVLNYKVGGSHISLESKVQHLETENTELRESVISLLKATYLLSSPRSPMAGPSTKQIELLEKYLKPIKHLSEVDLRKYVDNDIKAAHENGMKVHPDYYTPQKDRVR